MGAPLLQQRLCPTRSFGLMENSSPPGRVSPPAPLSGGTKSLLSCRNSRGCSRCLSHCGASPCRGNSSRCHRGLAAPGCNRVLVPTLSPPREPVSAPLPGRESKATKSHQKARAARLRVRCALPSTQRPKPALGLNTPEPLKTRSFPSSFTYVNDDPQEVIVGERRELASLDLLNHFITGTRSEWPLSAGSASPSPSAFI